MSGFGGFGVDAGASMLPSVEVGTLPSFPVVDPVALSVSPYPTIVDPFKRRTALREYFRGLRGENNKENEMDLKSPPSLPKQKTLGLCRRHPIAAKVSGEGASLRDKRKFNAPRQTPEKRQRAVESDGADVPRRLNQLVAEEDEVSQSLVQFSHSWEHGELELAMDQVPVGDDIQRPQMVYARAKDNVSSSVNHQPQDLQSLSLKRQEPRTIPTIRKPLTPVNTNRQASQVHSSPMPLKPNFSGGLEREGGGSGESLFQLASGKRFRPSAAAKARAASLFESDDAELADLLGFEG